MINDSYKVLGLTEYATDREISEAYFSLRKKYQEERFSDGEKGNEAARKLTEIDNAYDEITKYRKEHQTGGNETLYKQVDSALKENDVKKAQDLLDSFDERTAEWHYLQSVVFYKKNWTNECKKQLEIAMNLDPDNKKYKETYDRLLNKINNTGNQKNQNNNSNQGWNTSSSHGGGNNNANNNYNEQQMGGDSCTEFCCRLAICNICLNCLCNCR